MDSAKYKKITKACIKKALKKGMKLEDAKDFSHDFLERVFLPKKKQSIDYALVDYFRRNYSRPEYKKNSAIRNIKNSILNDEHLSNSLDCSYEIEDRILLKDIMQNALYKLNAKEKYIFYKYFIEGLSQNEIGKWLDLTESRINQILLIIKKKIGYG